MILTNGLAGKFITAAQLGADAKEVGFEEGKFYPKAQVDSYYKDRHEKRDAYEFCTYDEFTESDYLETTEYSYTTP